MRRTCACAVSIARPSIGWWSSPTPHRAGAFPTCSTPPRRRASVPTSMPSSRCCDSCCRRWRSTRGTIVSRRWARCAPERLFIAPPSRVVIAEAAFGPAIDHLMLSRSEAWRRYQVAVPAIDEAVVSTPRGDATALGAGHAVDAARPPSDGRRVPRRPAGARRPRLTSVMATTITRCPACSPAGSGARCSWTGRASSRRTPRRSPSRKCSPATGDTSPAPMRSRLWVENRMADSLGGAAFAQAVAAEVDAGGDRPARELHGGTRDSPAEAAGGRSEARRRRRQRPGVGLAPAVGRGRCSAWCCSRPV